MSRSDWPPDLEELIALLQADAATADDEEPPPQVVLRAQQLLRERRQPPAETSLRRLVASLLFNSAQQSLAFGVRALGGGVQQLVFAAGEFELDLRLATDGALHTISGQLLGPCPGAGLVTLTHPAQPASEASLTDLCEFALDPVPPGTYTLTLQVTEVLIEVPSLEVGGA